MENYRDKLKHISLSANIAERYLENTVEDLKKQVLEQIINHPFQEVCSVVG